MREINVTASNPVFEADQIQLQVPHVYIPQQNTATIAQGYGGPLEDGAMPGSANPPFTGLRSLLSATDGSEFGDEVFVTTPTGANDPTLATGPVTDAGSGRSLTGLETDRPRLVEAV